jgi:importin subunit beta-1
VPVNVRKLTIEVSRHDADNQLRTAAYEVLNTFVMNSAGDGFPIVAKLSDVILQRLEGTIPMQSQIVSVEDRMTLEEMQTSLTSVLLVSAAMITSPKYFLTVF